MGVEPHALDPDLLGECTVCPLPGEHPVHAATEPVLPETPYAGTSGWSGSQTSRERAETEDRTGVTSDRQQVVLAGLALTRERGLTWKELAASQDWHHGQASGALSALHKAGRIARLAEERRDRCAVYVRPEHVAGRPTAEQGRAAADPDVTKTVEWRVLNVDGDVIAYGTVEREVRRLRSPSRRLQTRTVVASPWTDVP